MDDNRSRIWSRLSRERKGPQSQGRVESKGQEVILPGTGRARDAIISGRKLEEPKEAKGVAQRWPSSGR